MIEIVCVCVSDREKSALAGQLEAKRDSEEGVRLFFPFFDKMGLTTPMGL